MANENTCKRACSPFPCGLWSHLSATFCQSRFQLTLLMYSSRSGMACSAIPVAMSPAHPAAQSVAPTPIARRMRPAPPDSAWDAHSRAIPGVIDDASLVLVLVKTPPLYASARREGLGEHPRLHESRLHNQRLRCQQGHTALLASCSARLASVALLKAMRWWR